MRLKQGDTSRVIYFVAVDSVDLNTRETSLTSGAVWYSIDGGAKTDMTSPTITHVNNGVFKLAIDEGLMVTIPAGVDSVELAVEITADEMATVTRTIEVYREKITAGKTALIGSDSKVLISTNAQDLSGTLDVNTKKITGNAITAAAIAPFAIANATFAVDLTTTPYATNIIAQAVRVALDELNLDHLMKVATSNRTTLPEVVDDTVLANLMTKTDGDTSDFDPTTDSLEAISDKIAAIPTASGQPSLD